MLYFFSMKKIKNHPIWLLWKKEVRKGKSTKVPYLSPHKYASSTDPKTWDTYYNLKKLYFDNQSFSTEKGIGIVFEKSVGIIGIDFDHCVINNKIDKEILTFIKKAKTYTEYSPSGTGIHLLFRADDKITPIVNKHKFDEKKAIEIYTEGRYFTFTENEVADSQPIRLITGDELTKLLETLGYPWGKNKNEEILIPVVQTSFNLDDEEITTKMFSSKNGDKVKRLWNGDITDYNKDYSSADHALCMHLAFWTGKTYNQIERLWLLSPLGQRKKTQEREDYRQRTVNSAITNTQDIYTPPRKIIVKNENDEEIDFEFILGGSSKEPYPLLIFPNILRVLRKDPYFRDTLRKNDFSHFVEFKNQKGQWEILNDDFISATREYIAENYSYFCKVSKDMTTDAILRVASDVRVNPPRDYFISLVWDGIPRINSWLHKTYGTPDDNLHQAISSNWLKGLVKRVMHPGCQFDEVLALESPQGYRKSTSLRVLGSPWHVETTHSMDNKDFYLILAQNVIVEFSEGEILDRASVNKLKAEITKTEDQLRPPYERGMVKFKRSCVFAVTTNRLELKDDTGNRRWLPVQLQKIADIDWLQENKDQLYAEAYHRVIVLGETTYEYPDSLSDLQESRQEYSDSDEKLLDYLSKFDTDSLQTGILTLDMACQAVLGDRVPINRLDEIRIAGSLRRMHFENERVNIDGKRVRRWVPKEKAIKNLQIIKEHSDNF